MRARALLSGVLLSGALAASARAGNVHVPLTVDETAGVARVDSLVTSGIPLPRGRVRETRHLRILDASGAAIPAQFQVLSRWSDGSVKWLLADFLATVPAGSTTDFALTADPFTALPAAPRNFALVTGPSEYAVLAGMTGWRAHLQGFEFVGAAAAGLTGEHVVGPDGGDLVLRSGGVDYRSSLDAASVVAVEEDGPLRIVVRAEGTFRDSAGRSLLGYVARLHYLNPSGALRIFLTLKNDLAASHPGNVWDLGSSGSRYFDDLSLELQLAPGAVGSWCAWTGTSPAPTACDSSARAVSLYQESSGGARWNWATHVNRFNVVPMTFRGWELRVDSSATASGDRAEAILDAVGAQNGIAVGVRHPWQNFPKALRSDAGGRVDVALWPADFPDVHELQGGEQKTHEIVLLPHGASLTPAQVHAAMTDLLNPLRARPDVASVARSLALGRIAPKDLAALPDWENTCEFIALDKGVRSFLTQREEIDEYGWRNFGEAFADHETLCGTQCWDCPISHDNNQYDTHWAALLGWIRSGEKEWLDVGEQGARHLMDVDVYHTVVDTPAYSGGMFWHTTHDTDAFTSTHRTYSALMSSACTPYLSGGPAPGHLYTEGLDLHGHLLGDRRAFEVLDELDVYAAARYAIDGPAPGSGYEVRAWANLLRAATASWQRTGGAGPAALARQVVLDSDARVNPAMTGTGFGDAMLMVALGRFLDAKVERGESADADASVARASLVELARRVRANHAPQQDVLDFRVSEGLWAAYLHSPPGDPDEASWAALASAYFQGGSSSAWFNTYITNKGLAHACTNGHAHAHFTRGRIPAEVGDLRARRVGQDVELSWRAVTADADGKALTSAEYAVHRSSLFPTRFTDRPLLSAPATVARATGDAGDGVRLHFYEVRAVAVPGIEGP